MFVQCLSLHVRFKTLTPLQDIDRTLTSTRYRLPFYLPMVIEVLRYQKKKKDEHVWLFLFSGE
jgi:hypothetical protein